VPNAKNLCRYRTFLPSKKGLIRPKKPRCCPFKIEFQFVIETVIKLGKEKEDKKCTRRLRYLWLKREGVYSILYIQHFIDRSNFYSSIGRGK
jgi:hypothetical protein